MSSDFFLTSYMEAKGARHAKKQTSRRAKLDYEAFVCAMETKRKWKAQRADVVWRELDTAANFADNHGPPPHCKRLKIPAHLLCEDWSESEVEVFEEKQRLTQSKGVRNMGAETVAQIDADMRCGFGALSSASVSSAAGSFTFQLEQSSSDGFLAVLTEAAIASGSISVASPAHASSKESIGGGAGARAASQGACASAPQASPAKVTGPFDVRSGRLALIREQTKKLVAVEKKSPTPWFAPPSVWRHMLL